MSRAAASIGPPAPVVLEGRSGERVWVVDPCEYTGIAAVDERLSSYPVVVFRPEGRPPGRTPVVVGLNGMAAPYHWLGFIVPTLLDLGIACVLFETPVAGERSLVRGGSGDIVREMEGFVAHRVPITTALIVRLFQAVVADFGTVFRLVEERYGLTDRRRALFGVSLGTVLSSLAFLKEGYGERLLGTIGHADLRRFASSYTPPSHRALARLPTSLLATFAGPQAAAGLAFLKILRDLASGRGHAHTINPMTYLDRAGKDRRVRFLVGANDPVVGPDDARECAHRFPDGECYVVPGLGHGDDAFAEHVRVFLQTQLGDWAW